ncbi:TatD family hydrolase [Neisseria yangbaofengii]|uniref:TatD family hydrolase n=1 Tax=Neisseria yangbaofengii TaxID=2709396 RepID=UPI0013EAB6A7|nr:TatD family hydrolase [Neisseria yangbaofengii]
MNFTDSHCHLADPALRDRLPEILAQAAEQGVMRFIVPATQRSDWADVVQLLEMNTPFEPRVHIALGIHPWFAEAAAPQDFAELECLLLQYPQAWVGETGLDFLVNRPSETQKQRQIETFRRQLELAQRLQRPVIVHNVKATAAIADAAKRTGFTQGGIVHAFSGSVEEARILLHCGFKIGIGSLLLNPKAKKVRQVVAKLAWHDMVLETDSPFMLHNETNTPANVRRIAEIAAELSGVDLAETACKTEENISKLLKQTARPTDLK